MSTPTPITDEQEFDVTGNMMVVPSEVARLIETKPNAANARAEAWKADAIRMKRLDSDHNAACLPASDPEAWCDCDYEAALAAHAKLMEGER